MVDFFYCQNQAVCHLKSFILWSTYKFNLFLHKILPKCYNTQRYILNQINIQIMKNLLAYSFFIWVNFSFAQNDTSIEQKFLAHIKGTLPLSEENISFLSGYRLEYSYFWLLRDTNALCARDNLAQYKTIFNQVEKKFNFSKNRLQKISFVESYGRNVIKSYAGAVGLMQFMPSTGREYGLKINQKLGIDERLIPAKAILASAKYLSRADSIFGNEDMSNASYHMGFGNMYKVISLYLADFEKVFVKVERKNAKYFVKKYGITMEKIYFKARPSTKLYNFLASLKDNSMSYFWGIKSAGNLLEMNDVIYDDLYYSFRNIFDPVQKAPARYCTKAWCIEGVECEEDIFDKEYFMFLDLPKGNRRAETLFFLRQLSELAFLSFREVNSTLRIVFSQSNMHVGELKDFLQKE